MIRAGNDLLDRLQTVGIQVDLALEEGLPPVRIDPGEFEDALINLVLNARDAMPNGGILRIATSVEALGAADLGRHPDARPGRFVRLSVIDSGCGMDTTILNRIFEPFIL